MGDNIDDALASQAAGIPFVGILFGRGEARRSRRELLKKLGALAVLPDVTSLGKLAASSPVFKILCCEVRNTPVFNWTISTIV